MRKTWIAAAVYIGVFALIEAYRWSIWSFGSDTGTFTQAILATGDGFRDGPEGGSHLFFHFSPILALLYPLLALTRSPLSLQLAQVVLFALTGPATFALFRPYVSEAMAVRLGVVALLYPPLASVAFGEFHEVAFFPACAIGLIWAADRCRWLWFAVFGAACVLTREDICLELAAVGAGVSILALMRRNAAQTGLLVGQPRQPLRASIAFACLSLAGAGMAVAYYHEVTAVRGVWPHAHFYQYAFAVGPLAILGALVTKPLVVLPPLMRVGRLTYLLEALAPLAFLPLRSPWILAAAPGLIVVLLASEQSVWRMGDHYAALWAPWMLIAAGAALMRLERAGSTRAVLAWTNGALAVCAVVLIAFNPMHVGHYLTPPYGDLASARAALACVPHDADVATHDEWFSEISAAYPHATIQTAAGPKYLVYADDFPNDRFRSVLLPALGAELRSGRYRIVCSFGNVKTYRRI